MLNSDYLDPQLAVKGKLSIDPGKLSNSGKLSLNKIVFYDYGHAQMTPSYLFDYESLSASQNPDFDPEKKDYWGFYKPDITSGGQEDNLFS